MSGTMDKIKAKVDNVLHKDKSNDPTGPHSSHAANSADPRVDSDHVGTVGNTAGAGGVGAGQYSGNTTHGTHGTTGLGSNTHSSGLGNTHSSGLGNTHSSGLGNTHSTGLAGNTHTHNDPTGPHSSHAGNQLDPRVDSDRLGTAGNTATAGGVGAGQYGSNTHSSGLGNTHSTTGVGSHATHGDPSGPHSSKMANKLDPTVDTKSYGTADPTTGHYANTGSNLTGTHNTSSGLTGTHQPSAGLSGSHTNTHNTSSGLTGTHQSGAGLTGSHTNTHNTSSGLTGTHQTGTVGSGNSNTTAGPHNSDMLNKVDPRVDSDLDGSKTMGGNATYR